MKKFLADVKRISMTKGNCLVAVSEGIHYADGSLRIEAEPLLPTASVMHSSAVWRKRFHAG